MKTTSTHSIKYLLSIFCFAVSFGVNAQSNCIVSDINGPTQISGSGNITQLYYVTSNGAHIWTLPAGASATYGFNGADSAYVTFNSSFTSGTITVRRNGAPCVNTTKSLSVVRMSCNMSANAGNDRTVYYGYAPLECTTLSVQVTNGNPPLQYSWSDGQTGASINVCPTSNTTYSVLVTDGSGCTASSSVTVNVIDVRCWAGNSNNQKVEVCHRGRNICISANAVPAHLAHGCMLGNCSETVSSRSLTNVEIDYHESDFTLNPSLADNIITIGIEDYDATINYSIEIYNSVGQIVLNQNIESSNQTINIEGFKPGIYFVKSNNHPEAIKKFIKN